MFVRQTLVRRVLGIDPGSRVTGYGVLDGQEGEVRFVEAGTIRLDESREMSERLASLYQDLSRIITEARPSEVAVERVFVSRNADSALKLGHARGVILLAVHQAGLPLYEYTPAMVKKSVAGRGRADKYQMAAMVRRLLGLPEEPPEDAADALAVGMCHLLLADERALLARACEGPR